MPSHVRRFAPALLLALLAVAGAAIPAVSAQPGAGQPSGQQPQGPGGRRPGGAGGGQPGQQPGGPGRAANIEGSMRAMNRALRELKTTVADASKRDQSLMSVYAMQAACASAKRAKPEHVEGDPAKVQEEFRRAAFQLGKVLIDLEEQVLDGKADDAKVTIAKIEALRDEQHKKFGVKDEEEEGGEGRPRPRQNP